MADAEGPQSQRPPQCGGPVGTTTRPAARSVNLRHLCKKLPEVPLFGTCRGGEGLPCPRHRWSMGETFSRGGKAGISRAALEYLERHLQSAHKDRAAVKLAEEYEALRHRVLPALTATLPGNARRNRYTNVVPYDFNRVHLGDGQYINASLISQEFQGVQWGYIASQGPLEGTSGDFWRMVIEQQCPVVVMLTPVAEGAKAKCWAYFAEKAGGSKTFAAGDATFRVDTQSCAALAPGVEVRVLQVQSSLAGSPVTVHHLFMRSWPDFGVPPDTTAMRAMCRWLRELVPLHLPSNCRPVVHCSAGIGRSGTFVAVDVALRRLDLLAEAGSADTSSVASAVGVPALVRNLREQRDGMVQGLDQYAFIYQCMVEALREG